MLSLREVFGLRWHPLKTQIPYKELLYKVFMFLSSARDWIDLRSSRYSHEGRYKDPRLAVGGTRFLFYSLAQASLARS